MKAIINLFLVLFVSRVAAQPWQLSYDGPNTNVYCNMYYNYHSQFGGVVLHQKPGGNYIHELCSYNASGLVTFTTNINQITHPEGIIVDNEGNRLVYGYDFTGFPTIYRYLQFDSLGTLTYSQSVAEPGFSEYRILIGSNNSRYIFYTSDVVTSFSMSVNYHDLKESIVKLDSMNNVIWQINSLFQDTTLFTQYSDHASRYISPGILSDGSLMYVHHNKSMPIGQNRLERISSNGTILSTAFMSAYPGLVPGANPVYYTPDGFVTSDTCYNVIGKRPVPTNTTIMESFLYKFDANLVLKDTFITQNLELYGGIESSHGDVYLNYFTLPPYSPGNVGLLKLNKNFNLKSVHPANTLERFHSKLIKNNIGGLHMGAYTKNPGYSGDHDFEMCNYDSSFYTYPNRLLGTIYKDENKNCVYDGMDQLMLWRTVICTDAQNKTYFGNSNSSGAYRIALPNGSYSISHDPGPYRAINCPGAGISLNFNNAYPIQTLNYFDTLAPGMQDLKVTMFGDPFWTSSCSYINVLYENVGTTTVSPLIKVVKDPTLSFSVTVPQANQINGDTAYFLGNAVAPDGGGFISISLNPTPTSTFGAALSFKAIIEPKTGDTNQQNNIDSLISLNYGGLKLAASASGVSTSNNLNVNKPKFIIGNEELVYKIRFQNTSGNTVHNVIIVDSLSPYLEWSTLRVLDASHSFSFSMNPNGKMIFEFNTLILSDSAANESQSKGYLVYAVTPKDSWPATKKLYNHADIYFDYFHLRTTNVTVNQKIPNAVGQNEFQIKQGILGVELFPNPAKDFVDLLASSGTGIQKIELHTISGVKLTEINFQTMVDRFRLETLSIKEGVYIVRITTNNGYVVKKLLINSKGS